jgi:hypothetical protein
MLRMRETAKSRRFSSGCIDRAAARALRWPIAHDD